MAVGAGARVAVAAGVAAGDIRVGPGETCGEAGATGIAVRGDEGGGLDSAGAQAQSRLASRSASQREALDLNDTRHMVIVFLPRPYSIPNSP